MDEEIVKKLAIAEQFSHSAQYAGVARQAVADGYSSIDALFSAIVTASGEKKIQNHWQKLERVKRMVPNLFATREERSENSTSYMGGIEWFEIEAYYREWLQSRYEAFELAAGTARRRVATTLAANHFVLRWLAEKEGVNWFDLLETVHKAAYGYFDSEISTALSRAHDYLFDEAEALGERLGPKLGIKMASATNFCGADIIAGDELTRRLIESDAEIANHASDVYVSFCRLMEKIRIKRMELIVEERSEVTRNDVLDISSDFMLSMKAKYHGEKLSETGAWIAEMLSGSIARLEPEGSSETPPGD